MADAISPSRVDLGLSGFPVSEQARMVIRGAAVARLFPITLVCMSSRTERDSQSVN